MIAPSLRKASIFSNAAAESGVSLGTIIRPARVRIAFSAIRVVSECEHPCAILDNVLSEQGTMTAVLNTNELLLSEAFESSSS